uniref:Centriolar coiled-coil protein of 110 kDa n=1 Tax=Graphocephala atropunctata TaxID=36148 RepID=A0A1B6KB14_9HEMI
MASPSEHENGFLSCIKIAGMSILPPLITEERRKELNEDKAKAIAIEKKLTRKRSSVDSGVMTGSYIDSFKNGELKQNSDFTTFQLSMSDLSNGNENFPEVNVESQSVQGNGNSTDSFLKSALEDPDFQDYFYITAERVFKNSNHDVKSQSSRSNSVSSDNFLRAALEDSEFREFFYTTADKIFKDNNTLNCDTNLFDNKDMYFETDRTICNGVDVTKTFEVPSDLSQYVKSNESLDISVCEDPTLVSPSVKSDLIHKSLENMPSIPTVASPFSRLVRRNSYTLDSPSPVLLEHMAKENAINKRENEKWISLTEKKDKEKKLEFKPFLSSRKARKTWDKRGFDYPPVLKDNTQTSTHLNVPLKRANTFVKSTTKSKKTNHSLPSSSCTSPIHLNLFPHSTQCINTMIETPLNFDRINPIFNINSIPEAIKEIKSPQRVHQATSGVYEVENMTTVENSVDLSIVSSKENTNGSSQFICDTDSSLLHSIEPSDSASQISTVTQFTVQQLETSSTQCKRGQPSEMDDSESVCSSLSLSKFLPSDSRPSTAEGLSALFSELQLQHERQITELLEKQHKEKVLLTKLHSNSETSSSRSTSHISVFDLSLENNFPQTSSEENRSSCSRELFPNESLSLPKKEPRNARKYNYDSEKEKAAALKITACVRGYLTRRLLKTEKVQQTIDVIKESLSCAFSLQCETQLRKNDLELHERLAYQLSAALNELWSIVSAPVAKRMAIIAADRERLKKPLSRPSSAISTATRKSLLRKQKSLVGADESQLPQENRHRTKSLCLIAKPNLTRSRSFVKSNVSSRVRSSSSSRRPWK